MTLSIRDTNRLKRAMKLSELSQERHKHGAAIYRGGALISVGVNVIKNDPYIVGRDAANPDNHAETMAIRGCSPDADLSNAIIYVARTNSKGQPLNSAPCESCMEAIRASGIKRIVHT